MKLSDCEARITDDDAYGHPFKLLWFDWGGHQHAIPFDDVGSNLMVPNTDRVGLLVWKRVSGSTVQDLTLAPSYFCKSPEPRRLHCFIRDGQIVVV